MYPSTMQPRLGGPFWSLHLHWDARRVNNTTYMYIHILYTYTVRIHCTCSWVSDVFFLSVPTCIWVIEQSYSNAFSRVLPSISWVVVARCFAELLLSCSMHTQYTVYTQGHKKLMWLSGRDRIANNILNMCNVFILFKTHYTIGDLS